MMGTNMKATKPRRRTAEPIHALYPEGTLDAKRTKRRDAGIATKAASVWERRQARKPRRAMAKANPRRTGLATPNPYTKAADVIGAANNPRALGKSKKLVALSSMSQGVGIPKPVSRWTTAKIDKTITVPPRAKNPYSQSLRSVNVDRNTKNKSIGSIK